MPKLTIIAGPNGSGKSTLTRNTQSELNVPIIDPDAEAKKINASDPESVAVTAGRQAIRLARGYLENNESFAVETTLSGNTYIKMMQQAKQQGYEISLLFIGINNVDTNIKRVTERVATGGHNVPEEDIRRRYERSMVNLPIALQLTDSAIIFDNSKELGHQIKLAIENAKIIQQSEDLPEWIVNAIPQEQIQSLQNESIAQSIYPIARNLVKANQNRLEEISTGVFTIEGNNYKIVLNQNNERLSIFRQNKNNQELARYNTSNDSLISTKGLTEQDSNNWNRIQTIQQDSQQTNISTQEFEL